ncbi:MAG TPA: hypothetical protein VF175_05705, partial [Lacipirellula sp.]
YMSPEQAAGRLDRLGPTSDVYSLGATLYVLLTGRAPQEEDDLGIVLQRVQRGEFPPPRSENPQAPRGLEAICLKAMALDPQARYQSARALGDDIEAWLADEPITARPDSVRAKAFRWIKNHRTLVTSGAAMVLVALVALSAFNVQLRVANDRERDAKNTALAAQRKAEAAQAEAERQAARNAELVDLARQSLDRYETLSQSELLRSYGMEPLRRDLLEVALNFYATLAAQLGESEQARSDRADALQRMAATYWQLGPVDEALAAYDKSIARFKELAADFPEEAEYAQGVASGLVAKAELMNIARDAAGAEAMLAEARQVIGGMLAREPASRDARIRMAYVHSLDGERLRQLGRLDEAASVFAEGIKLLEAIDAKPLDANASLDVRYRLGRALNQLAALEAQALWRFEAGRRHYDQAEAVFTQLYKDWPDNGDVGHSFVQVLRNSGHLHARQHFYEQAKAAYSKALEVITEVEQQSPGAVHYRREMAEVLHSLGTLHRPLEDGDASPEALARLEQAVAISGELAAQSPQDVSRLLELVRYQSSLGQAYLLRQRSEDADRIFNAALASLKAANELTGDNVDALYTLGQLQYTIAEQLGNVSRNEESLAMLDAAEASLEKLISLSPQFGEAYLSLWNVFIERSSCYALENRLVDSIVELDRIAAMDAKMQELAEAPWMQAGARAVTTLGRSLRWGRLKQIRDGGMNALTAAGEYELAGEQARQFPELTREAGDHYVAARALAYAATAANVDEKFADGERMAVVEPLAADAVKQLELAWEKGFLRRRSSMFGGLLRGGVELAELKEVFEFGILQDREDYRKLVERIESEKPRRERTSNGKADAE